ncbi:MAG TPA: hypothetical protein VLA93_12265 [Pyrinomonadaceae bacterium]|nr:hypothetical protein [Pyrinomonadaceae bacterium]
MPTADISEQIKQQMGEKWLPHIYAQRVLRVRTRLYRFAKPRPTACITIQHTLLGIELKIGRQRLLCPDLATARYLSIFARVGCQEIAIPYDITKISHLADEFESSWYRMLLLVEQYGQKQTDRFAARLRRLLFANIRDELLAADGARSKD